MSLPSFTVDFAAGLQRIWPTLTGGELTETPPSFASIAFVSNIPVDSWITYAGTAYPAPDPVPVTVAADGTLAGTGDPVKLLANDPGLNVNVQWTAQAVIDGRKMRPIVFDAPTDDAVLDLATVVPAAPTTAAGIPVTMAMVYAAIAASGGGGGTPGVIDGGDAASSGAGTIDGGSA